MGNPEGAEAKLASEEAARTSPSWGVSHEAQKGIGSEIRNLPDNLILTKTRFLNNICRVCATYHEKGPMMLPLFYYDKGTRPLAKLVHTLLSVKVVPKDGLPKNACRECACKLFEWSAMRDKAADAQKLLHSQTELLIEDPHHHIYRSVKSDLTDTVESVLATYSLNISSMELVCLECNSKTSREDFPHHLSSKHCLTSQEDVEAFVRDHVTFDERLDSEDDTSFVSTEAFDGQCFDCPICSTAFPSRSRLSQHLTIHDVSTDSTSCGGGGNNTELIANSKKDPTNPLQCKSCSHLASDMTALVTHTTHCTNDPHPRDETNQKRIPAVCPDCNRTFSNKYNMLTHMKSHRETRKFDCECGKSYSTRGNLLAHARIAHSGRLVHACSECGAGFPSRAARDVHSRLHSGARPFVCAHCARSFRAKNSLDRHRETHEPRRHECQLCGKKFRRRSHLRADADLGPPAADPQRPEASPRAEVPARKRRRFGCPTCGRVFTDAANLARHVRALHAARRPHACAECGRAFTRAEHLRAHALRHSAPAPLLCEACGARCASAAALRSHRRTHAAACHACACGARFRRAGELRAHASVHGGARPHACGCGRAFRLRAQLNMHARRHAAAAAGEDDDPAPDHCADFTRPRQPNVPMIRDPFIDNLDFDRIARDVADM